MRLIVLTVLTLTAIGCRAPQLKQDQHAIRQSIIDLQTEQIMDNLIRAHLRLPFVHIDYRKSVGTVTQEGRSGISTSQVANTILVGAPNSLLSETFDISAGGENTAQLTIEAAPVYDQNEVYKAYLKFLVPDPMLGMKLIESYEAPPCGAAHMCREYCGRYFWVPQDFANEFLELSLKTTVLRGDAVELPKTFEVTIEDVVASIQRRAGFTVGEKSPDSNSAEQLPTPSDQVQSSFSVGDDRDGSDSQDRQPKIAILKFNKEIPNDTGEIRIPVGDKTLIYRVENPEGSAEVTKQLRVSLAQLEVGPQLVSEARAMFIGKTAQIRLDSYRPEPKSTADLLKDLNSSVELLRLNELRTSN